MAYLERKGVDYAKKPPKCCHPDCFSCPYNDCIWNGITDNERISQNDYDKKSKRERIPEEKRTMKKGRKLIAYDNYHMEKSKIARKQYEQTEEGKARKQKYYQSEKGKEAQKRYLQSDKGKEMQKRKNKRRWQKELERRDMEKWRQEVREYNKLNRYGS